MSACSRVGREEDEEEEEREEEREVIHVPKLIKSGIRAPHMVNSG